LRRRMDDVSVSTKASKTKSTSSAVRPRPSEGRVIGLPSTTSTGLWAVRDEHNTVDDLPSSRAKKSSPSDIGFINNTELNTLQNLNENLQQRIASLNIQKNDAIAASTEAEARIQSLTHEMDMLSNEHENRENELLSEIHEYKLKIDQQNELLAELPRRVATAEAYLELEKQEVQRAVSHARSAGQAADKANKQLANERRIREELEHKLSMLTRQGSTVSQDLNKAIDSACADLKSEIEELKIRCVELEEDAETEREWRESAQKERNEAVERCSQLQQHAELVEASVDKVKSESLDLHKKLEKLRYEAEEAEAKKEEDEKIRKERVRKRLRDQQSEAYHSKQSDKAKLASYENEIAKLKLENEDYPRLQQAVRQEKRRNATLHTQVRELTARLRTLGVNDIVGSNVGLADGGDDGGGTVVGGLRMDIKSSLTPRDTSPVVASPRRKSSSSTANSSKAPLTKQHSSPLLQSSPPQRLISNRPKIKDSKNAAKAIPEKQPKGGNKISSSKPLSTASQSANQSTSRRKTSNEVDDFDFDDDDDDDDNFQQHNYDDDLDGSSSNMYGGEDDDKRIFMDHQARGPRKHVLQARDYQNAHSSIVDAAAMPGSDAPDWLRD
jgi:myosin heavy subunit